MDPATKEKSLENNLTKAALVCAYTLTPATGFQPPVSPLSNADSLDDRVRRVRPEGRPVYKYEDSKYESGKTKT